MAGIAPQPIEMRGHNAVFRPRGCHTDHFLRAKISGDKSEAGDPERHATATHQEIVCGLDLILDHKANAQHHYKVKDDNEVIG
jgi:hypothetical protein